MIVEVEQAGESLAEYTNLTDVALRRRIEPENGLYMAESSNVIARAVAAGHTPRSFLMAPRWLESMAPVIELPPAPRTGARYRCSWPPRRCCRGSPASTCTEVPSPR